MSNAHSQCRPRLIRQKCHSEQHPFLHLGGSWDETTYNKHVLLNGHYKVLVLLMLVLDPNLPPALTILEWVCHLTRVVSADGRAYLACSYH